MTNKVFFQIASLTSPAHFCLPYQPPIIICLPAHPEMLNRIFLGLIIILNVYYLQIKTTAL